MITLGIGDIAATCNRGETLITHGLGSCIAVILLDPATRTVGMDHIALPDSALFAKGRTFREGYFADTGIPILLRHMQQAGSCCMPRQYLVRLVGGASVLDPNRQFNIGERNLEAIMHLLRHYNIGVLPGAGRSTLRQETGGHICRTVRVEVDSGNVTIHSPGKQVCVL